MVQFTEYLKYNIFSGLIGGVFINAFQILNRKRLVAEIRQKYNAGGEKAKILDLDKYAKENSLLNYDKDALKKIGGWLFPE